MLIAEGIGAYFGKLPVALQKNVTKALGHLLGVPMAYLDGVASELKAVSAARVKVTEAMGLELAKSVKVDSELAEIATATHANKILRHQKNSIKVLKYAAEEMENVQLRNRIEPSLSPEPSAIEFEEISDDWLNAFEAEAVNMSSEQMQRLFGKMLAGEINRPSTFSIRTIKLMGQMDSDVAGIFRKFCSISSSCQVSKTMVVDGRVIVFKRAGSGSLHDFGLPHSDLLTLEEYGLLVDVQPQSFPYDICILRTEVDDRPKIALTYNERKYVLIPESPKTSADFDRLDVYGIGLSRVGRELLTVVESQENENYTAALVNYFKSLGLRFYEIPENL
ncbi:MAG TPA: DUF2806 domain-containing protein [Telluria sp.]|jgi:hypothetical protein